MNIIEDVTDDLLLFLIITQCLLASREATSMAEVPSNVP